MTRAADPAKAMRANGLILGSSSLLKPGMIRQILKQNKSFIYSLYSLKYGISCLICITVHVPYLNLG